MTPESLARFRDSLRTIGESPPATAHMHAAKAFTATAGLVRGGLGSSLAAVAGPTMRAYSSSLAGCWRSRSGGTMVTPPGISLRMAYNNRSWCQGAALIL